MPRHATRFALPVGTDLDGWLAGDGTFFDLDERTAARRARAATVTMLALPGSAYLYQGEELGLLEAADLPRDQLRDPVYERTEHRLKGRDGCRVPLPWSSSGSSFGFGDNGSWLPQPGWFGDYSVESQTGRPDSSLELYRAALHLRRLLATDEQFQWITTDDPQVLHFARSGGWSCLLNFSPHEVAIPGRIVLSSNPDQGATLAPETAVWVTDA